MLCHYKMWLSGEEAAHGDLQRCPLHRLHETLSAVLPLVVEGKFNQKSDWLRRSPQTVLFPCSRGTTCLRLSVLITLSCKVTHALCIQPEKPEHPSSPGGKTSSLPPRSTMVLGSYMELTDPRQEFTSPLPCHNPSNRRYLPWHGWLLPWQGAASVMPFRGWR